MLATLSMSTPRSGMCRRPVVLVSRTPRPHAVLRTDSFECTGSQYGVAIGLTHKVGLPTQQDHGQPAEHWCSLDAVVSKLGLP